MIVSSTKAAAEAAPELAQVHPRWAGRRLWQVVMALCVGYLAGASLYTFRVSALKAAARTWILDDRCAKADAIVVLGGGLEYRTFAAARLYRAGVAPKILIARPRLPPTAQMGLTLPEFVLDRYVLLSNAVPESAIEMIGTNVTSTRDEAQALRQWVEQRMEERRTASGGREGAPLPLVGQSEGAGERTQAAGVSVVIPTDIFHTRRARWIFSRVLKGTGAVAHIAAVDPLEYNATNWWQHEQGVIGFQNEVAKTVYYWVKY